MSYTLLADPERRGSDGPVWLQTVRGREAAAEVAAHLVRESVEYHVEPLPNNRWEFRVKGEHARILSAAAR